MDETQTWSGIRSILRRRWRLFLFLAVPTFLTAAVTAVVLPPVYQSSARILVEEQQIPREYVQTTVTSYVEERLQTITQQIMSRSKLLDIIGRFNLYPDMRRSTTIEEVLEVMRKAINMKTVSASVIDPRSGRSSQATIAFSISYEGKDPGVVQKVADTLASLYLDENLKSREKQATNTTSFLQQELDQLRAQAEVLEGQIGAFKRAHAGALPENSQMNQQNRDRLAQDLERLTIELRSLQERKVYLEGQLALVSPVMPRESGQEPSDPRLRLRDLRLKLAALRGRVSDQHPDVKMLRKEIQQIEAEIGPDEDPAVQAVQAAQLAALQEQLTQKRTELGPQHPDVLALAKSVEVLAKDLQNSKPRSNASDPWPEASNPAFINLKTQLASVEVEIRGLTEERRRVEQRMRDVEGRVARAPLVEQDYAKLTRDYQTAQRKYDDIMAKLMEAKVAQGMEESQRAERFTILDPAPYPEKPYKPNRKAIVLIGLVLALGAGVGGAAARESFDHSVKSTFDILDLTDLPVLCALPFIEEDKAPSTGGRGLVLWLVGGVCAAATCLLLIHLLYSPLDVLWFRLLRKFG